jgi:hypothetical protein
LDTAIDHLFLLIGELEVVPLEFYVECALDFLSVEVGLRGLLVSVGCVVILLLEDRCHYLCHTLGLHIRFNTIVLQLESVTEIVAPIFKKKDDNTSNANQQTSQPYFDRKKI